MRHINSVKNIHLQRRKEAARLPQVSVSTLDRWRMLGCGPIDRQLTGGLFYAATDLEQFISAGQRTSTGRLTRSTGQSDSKATG